MTPEMEQKVLETMYSRLYDAITFSPGAGRQAPFDRNTAFVQLDSMGTVLNPDDFQNLITPQNPNGDLLSTEFFSRMVDTVPLVKADYKPSTSALSTVYKSIVDGANSSVPENPQQKHIYNLAWDYLHDTVKIVDFTGEEKEEEQPSPIAVRYDENQTAYATTVSGYRAAYFGYDLTDPQQQRQWMANAPMLELAVTQAYNKWRREGAPLVEQATAALNTTINSGIRSALFDAQQRMANGAFPSALLNQPPWYLAYALPTNWANPTAKNFAAFHLESSHLSQTSSERFRSYGGGASWFGGLFSIGASASGSSEARHYHMEADQFELDAEMLTVRIFRPWLNGLIFRMSNWYNDAFHKDGVSNGGLQGNENGALPLIPTAFVVVRNLSIRANFSSTDWRLIREQLSAGGGLRIGPFSLGGRYSHSKTETSFSTTEDGGTLKVPGLQVFAWVSEVTPPSPPQEPPR